MAISLRSIGQEAHLELEAVELRLSLHAPPLGGAQLVLQVVCVRLEFRALLLRGEQWRVRHRSRIWEHKSARTARLYLEHVDLRVEAQCGIVRAFEVALETRHGELVVVRELHLELLDALLESGVLLFALLHAAHNRTSWSARTSTSMSKRSVEHCTP